MMMFPLFPQISILRFSGILQPEDGVFSYHCEYCVLCTLPLTLYFAIFL